MYADVILPLPLYASFTYEVPPGMAASLRPGCRVLVQFGRSKIYTGIVEHIHALKPANYEVKPIIEMLDSEPVLRNPQLKFWEWISQYYLCSPGDVMKAALPSALKIESETWVEINPDSEDDEIENLSEQQAEIIAYVDHQKRVRISKIEQDLKISNARTRINQLLEKRLIRISERLINKYVTQKVTFVTLCCERGDEQAIQEYFKLTSRSEKQEKLLLAYLDASAFLNTAQPLKPVIKKELLERTGITPAIYNALVKKNIFRSYTQAINRFMAPENSSEITLPQLSEAQETALRSLHRSMGEKGVTLLRGVTGSGKTEIYAHLINEALSHGDQVLFLVPEISLTTQLTTRLQRIFGNRLLVYHSKFSDSERVDIWRRLLSGNEPMVVLGVRSSVFLPFSRLGLIVVDEEHESSYKQYDPAPRYNARDAAIVLASMHGAKILLGSATPSIETYYKALNGKYGLVELTERFGKVSLPKVEVVDMGEQRKKKSNRGVFSSTLLKGIEQGARDHTQSILFQNRRGYAPIVICSQCGWVPKCENCDVSLVYHKRIGELRCHYCGYSLTLPKVCPACGENTLTTFGYGTERIAEDLHNLYPSLRISRMDLDTTRNKDGYEDIIGEFSRHETDVLVGTQMVSKGLDFEKVKFVGILNADTMLNFPDFRSDERAYNMMEQVAGRAGRHGQPGTVVIQTTKPDNEIISRVIAHDYTGYYKHEIEQRREFAYPPFTRVINIYLKHKDEKQLIEGTVKFTIEMQRVFGRRVLGPEAPFVSRVSNLHIRTLMLKVEAGASMPKVKELLRQIQVSLAPLPAMKQMQIHYDVDPV